MQPEDIQEYIYEHIPIVKSNHFLIQRGNDNQIQVLGSCREHINHRNSVFGGSLSTALILTAWATVRELLLTNGINDGIIVIQSQEVQFLKPVTRDFLADTVPICNPDKQKFLAILGKFGKSRIMMESIITHQDDSQVYSTFKGSFVVVLAAST